jgi:hypothetical protein
MTKAKAVHGSFKKITSSEEQAIGGLNSPSSWSGLVANLWMFGAQRHVDS